MIIGTAGHVDHGKTALVKALTGVDADRLAEEKARGMTIDLGYAYAPLPDGSSLGFVDVPGHGQFIHNLLAGVTGIGFALLAVAADDGIMPQTVEHLQILGLLGIRRGAIALTKCDRVPAVRVAEVAQAVQGLLQETGLGEAAIFPVSVVTGQGVGALRAHLQQAAAGGGGAVRGGFRLAVDRCFSVAGAGTVVTGTVFSGRVQAGDALWLSPAGLPVRVRGLHTHNRPAPTGQAGQRCALNLAGVDRQQIQRGDWLLAEGLRQPTQRLDVCLRLLAGELKPLATGASVHLHLGAFHATGRVVLLQAGRLPPGDEALAQIMLDRPTAAVYGDRIILRDAAASRTLGGATVLDARPPVRGRRAVQRMAVLAAWQQPDAGSRWQALLAASPDGLDLPAFAANANLTAGELAALCAALPLRRVGASKATAFTLYHWDRLGAAVVATLRQTHVDMPDLLGLNAEQLRLKTAPRLERTAFAECLAEWLAAGQLVRDGSWWHLPGHQITLTAADESRWRRLAPKLAEQPFQPPRVRDIARAEGWEEAAVRRLLAQVARTGQVYKMAHDHYFDREAVARLAQIIRELALASPGGAVTAAGFRDRIGTGRKLAIHILEYFDRVGLTRRTGDAHRLRDNGLAF